MSEIKISPRFSFHRPPPIVIEPTKQPIKQKAEPTESPSPTSTPLSRLCQSPLPSPKQKAAQSDRLSSDELALLTTTILRPRM